MSFIVDFYKNLDAVNLLIFWGIIIVITLLLVFSIILINKNKKLEKIIISKNIDLNDDDNEIPMLRKTQVTTEEPINTTKVEEEIKVAVKEEPTNEMLMPEVPQEDNLSNKFIAEEHVIEYQENKIKKEKNDSSIDNNISENKEIIIPTKPYQKNILKEMTLNQTSPIGIGNNIPQNNSEITHAEDLYNSLNEKKETETSEKIAQLNAISNTNIYKKGNYLEELSKNNSKLREELKRTEYEIEQEEEAIISYDELMKKKDNIKTIDEEEAVISINELIQKKKAEEKLYNLNSNEDDDIFINELKNFRKDL